jgi:carboxyl-terminal processing protease
VREDSPAKRAGLERGDSVWGINETSLEGFKTSTEAVTAIANLEFSGKPFSLSIQPKGGVERKSVSLEPDGLKPWLPSFELRNDGVAVITFYQFLTTGLIASKVHEYVKRAQTAGARAIILDLRGSGGGSGYESAAAAGAFMTQPVGTIFETARGKSSFYFQNGAIENTNFRIPEPALWTGKLLVLTNHISRSAAEYTAFFLQNAGRATVIGEATAGVLNTSTSIYPLPGGSNLAVTYGRSSTLNGVPHPEKVTPDIPLTDDMATLTSGGRDLILERALESLR